MIVFDVDQDLVPEAFQLSDERLGRIVAAFSHALPEVAGRVQVVFVGDEEIQRLNRMYRGKDKVTDVLSFGSTVAGVTGELGDVVISFPQAERQAEEGDIELEIADLLIHGILHLLGYDHEEAADAALMFPLQDAIVAQAL